MLSLRNAQSIGFDLDQTLTKHSILLCVLSDMLERQIHRTLECAVDAHDAARRVYHGIGGHEKPTHPALRKMKGDFIRSTLGVTPQAEQAIRTVSEDGIPLYLVSNGPGGKWGHRILRHSGCEDVFQTVIFGEDAPEKKDSPRGIQAALGDISISAGQDSFYIGNAASDMIAATRAEITPIAFGERSSAAKYLREAAVTDQLTQGMIIPDWAAFSEVYRNPDSVEAFCLIK